MFDMFILQVTHALRVKCEMYNSWIFRLLVILWSLRNSLNGAYCTVVFQIKRLIYDIWKSCRSSEGFQFVVPDPADRRFMSYLVYEVAKENYLCFAKVNR